MVSRLISLLLHPAASPPNPSHLKEDLGQLLGQSPVTGHLGRAAAGASPRELRQPLGMADLWSSSPRWIC